MIERPLIVIQATTFCNIDCSYCYLPERSATKRASIALIRRIADEVFSAPWWSGEYKFLWHLGEPLTLPIAYYEQAFAEIDQAARLAQRSYLHSFQTNATLIDDDWTDFFLRHRVQIGVSVDGPAFIHDRCRVRRDGRGTHALTLRGIEQLQRSSVEFGAIGVLTSFSLDFADEMFAFFHEHAIRSLAFNIDELEGVHRETSFRGLHASERYGDFLARFLELNAEHGDPISLREWRVNVPALRYGVEPYEMGNQPLRIVTFDCDGNFSSFCPELRVASSPRFDDFVMGNILTQSLSSIVDNQVFLRVRDEVKAGLDLCASSCDYWRFCGGGQPSSKYFEHERFDVTETTTCRVHKMVTVDAVLAHLERKQLRATSM